MSSYNAHDDLQRSPSWMGNVHTPEGRETRIEVRSEWTSVVTMRVGEIRISEKGVRLVFEFGSPVKEIR